MNTFSRRTFMSGAAIAMASLGISSQRVLAEWLDLSDVDSYVSELTGAEIAVHDSGLTLRSKHNAELNTEEVVLLGNDTSVTAVTFLPSGTAIETYLESQRDLLLNFYPATEEVGSGILADGGWLAIGFATTTGRQRGVYVEHQVGAFPEHDLVIDFTADLDTFADDFASLQKVTIEGFEPCLFMAESQIETLVFPALILNSTDQTRTSTTGSRTSRSTSSSDDTNTTNSRLSPRNRGANGSVDNVYVESVRAHRSEFLTTYAEFFDALSLFNDDTRTDAQVDEAFAIFDRLADLWVAYPARAAELAAPTGYESLEGLYITWADEIAELGFAWMDAINGIAEVSVMFDQLDIVDQADQALANELDAL